MVDLIILLIILIIVGGAVAYVYMAKKRGQTCIGCPHAKKCAAQKCNCEIE